jgi:hypothetical protein
MFNDFPRSRAVCEIMWKDMVKPDRPQMTKWRMHFSKFICQFMFHVIFPCHDDVCTGSLYTSSYTFRCHFMDTETDHREIGFGDTVWM